MKAGDRPATTLDWHHVQKTSARADAAMGLRSSLIGIGFNLVLAMFKCLAGFIGHSFALVADGIESLSDVIRSTVVYLGLSLAIKPPDHEHPCGHGKVEPVAAVIVSLRI
jgi:divalent metal cation (Fe/Co/Zn/Cd) transporter